MVELGVLEAAPFQLAVQQRATLEAGLREAKLRSDDMRERMASDVSAMSALTLKPLAIHVRDRDQVEGARGSGKLLRIFSSGFVHPCATYRQRMADSAHPVRWAPHVSFSRLNHCMQRRAVIAKSLIGQERSHVTGLRWRPFCFASERATLR